MDEKELHGLKDVETRLEKEHHLIAERVKKLNGIKELGIDPYPHTFHQTHHSKEIKDKYSHLNNEQVTEDVVNIAGRIVGMRRLGKVTFAHISDNDGKIQVLFNETETYTEKSGMRKRHRKTESSCQGSPAHDIDEHKEPQAIVKLCDRL